MAIQLSMESHQYKLFDTKSNAICPFTTDLLLYSVGNVIEALGMVDKFSKMQSAFDMAAKTTDFFGSDARLHVKELDGNSMVKLLNELVELFGISLMTTNEG